PARAAFRHRREDRSEGDGRSAEDHDPRPEDREGLPVPDGAAAREVRRQVEAGVRPPREVGERAEVSAEAAGGRLSAFLRRLQIGGAAERWSLVVAFVGAFAFFAIARPNTFLTWNNLRTILDNASAPSVLAVGVTVVLVLGEFDLSVGSVVG